MKKTITLLATVVAFMLGLATIVISSDPQLSFGAKTTLLFSGGIFCALCVFFYVTTLYDDRNHYLFILWLEKKPAPKRTPEEQLQDALDKQDYEEAARLRDMYPKLKTKKSNK